MAACDILAFVNNVGCFIAWIKSFHTHAVFQAGKGECHKVHQAQGDGDLPAAAVAQPRAEQGHGNKEDIAAQSHCLNEIVLERDQHQEAWPSD